MELYSNIYAIELLVCVHNSCIYLTETFTAPLEFQVEAGSLIYYCYHVLEIQHLYIDL